MKHVALLRGINVGGNNKLPMKALAALFEKAGCTQVQTYIQSGNVVFVAKPSLLRTLADDIPALIAKHHRLTVPIVLRGADELRAVVARNPFAPGESERTYVVFLASKPKAAQTAKLAPSAYAPDRFVVDGANVYLHLPAGAAKTKLGTTLFDRVFDTVSTARNWRTTCTLADLASEA